MKNKNLYKALSVLFALLLWQGVCLIVNAEYLLASPIDVVKRLFTLILEPSFLQTTLYSFLRITGGFLVGFALGVVFANLAGRFKIVEYFLWPFVVTVKAVPIASFIILYYIWFDISMLATFISFLIVFPLIYKNTLEGIKNTDIKLIEVAKIYNVSYINKLRYITIPSVKPFILSACSVAVGMAWKAGVAAEIICMISKSIGGKLYDAKVFFQNADLLAWTVIIVILSVLSEKAFLALLKLFFERNQKV